MQENRVPQIETITKPIHNDSDDGNHKRVIQAPAYALEGSTGDYSGSETIWVEGVAADKPEFIKAYVENRRRIPSTKWVYKTVNGEQRCDYLVEDENDTHSSITMIDVIYGNKQIGRWHYANNSYKDNINDKSGSWEFWKPEIAV